jgi:hypothetical protein
MKLPSQLGRRYAKGFELVRQDFAWVMGSSSHRMPSLDLAGELAVLYELGRIAIFTMYVNRKDDDVTF